MHSVVWPNLGSFAGDLMTSLLDSTCLLLSAKAREVVDAALSLLKVQLGTFSEAELAPFLKDIVSTESRAFM